jgi:hypothetical protein
MRAEGLRGLKTMPCSFKGGGADGKGSTAAGWVVSAVAELEELKLVPGEAEVSAGWPLVKWSAPMVGL